jgi:hypothetical protein
MESKSDLLEEQPPSMDVRSAIEELQSRKAAFEQRFTGLGDALVEINSALQGLQTAVQDLVFNRQRPVQEEKKAESATATTIEVSDFLTGTQTAE